jgi:hypothetical protein
MIKIVQVNDRYYIEMTMEGYKPGRLHVLNKRSLEWNLRKNFGYSKLEVRAIVDVVSEFGFCELQAA